MIKYLGIVEFCWDICGGGGEFVSFFFKLRCGELKRYDLKKIFNYDGIFILIIINLYIGGDIFN